MDLSGPLRPQSALLRYSPWYHVPLGHLARMRLMWSSAKEDYLTVSFLLYRSPGVPLSMEISVSLRLIPRRMFALRNKAPIRSDISRIEYPLTCRSSKTCTFISSYIYTSIACSPYGIDREETTTLFESCLDFRKWSTMTTPRRSDTTVWLECPFSCSRLWPFCYL